MKNSQVKFIKISASLVVAVLFVSVLFLAVKKNSEPEIKVCDRLGEVYGDNPDDLSVCEVPDCNVGTIGGPTNRPCYRPEGVFYD